MPLRRSGCLCPGKDSVDFTALAFVTWESVLKPFLMETAAPTREQLRLALRLCLKRLRQHVGLAQERLAFEAGLDRRYMGGLEQGMHTPTLETIYKLLPPLDITFSQFAGEFERALQNVCPKMPRHKRKNR